MTGRSSSGRTSHVGRTVGGRELTQAHERAYNSIESRYLVPNTSYFGIGLGMVAPTILAHGQPTVKDVPHRPRPPQAQGEPGIDATSPVKDILQH